MVRNKRDLFSPKRTRPVSRAISRVGLKPGDSDSTNSSCANVKVVVRVRPPNQKELGNNSRTVIKVVDHNVLIFDPKEEDEPFFYHGVQQRNRDVQRKANKHLQFTFDRVFGYEADNSDVFNDSTKNLIPSLMDGYNCSVFVYGATGAGKTHTMLGHNENPGITFLTMRELFDQIEKFHSEREFELAITYLEVYNETVKDLLNPGAPLHLREDGKFGVCVAGIKVHRINNPEELFALLAEGNANRTQHPTDANAESSRSHAVFQVYINMQFRTTGQRRIAKLSMIDLAGSERACATGCSGIRFTEGANINKSLLALGNCINSLADGQKHIPYRDSKLTRILKDSLGRNCQTVMIANVGPSMLNYEDTYNTLKYATRAKKIKSSMTKNVVSCTLTVAQYKKLVEDLNSENESLKEDLRKIQQQNKENSPVNATNAVWKPELQSLLKEKNIIAKEILRLLNSENILKHKIKFKEFSETMCSDTCLNSEDVEPNRNRIHKTVGVYQRQLNSVQSQIQDLKSQQRVVETKLENLVEKEQIPTDDRILLQNEIHLKTEAIDLQKEHTNKIVNICQSEIEQKDKMMTNMYDVLNSYYQLLRSSGQITDKMNDDHLNIVHMATGARSVTWQDENVVDTKSQDSGISVIKTPTVFPLLKSKINSNTPYKSTRSSEKRTTVKRKLYEVEQGETKSTSAIDNFIKKHLINDNESKAIPNLNETITLAHPIEESNINSTFCLRDKKKKSAILEGSNNVLKADLKKRTASGKVSKLHNITSKTQRFPLRKPTQETVISNRAARIASSTMRINKQI